MLTQFNIEDLLFYQIAMERGVKKGVEKGVEKGKLFEKQQLAQTMLEKRYAISVIADLVKLSEEKFLKLLNLNNTNLN